MPVTEIATLPLKAESDILDTDSDAARIWRSMCETILRQNGCQGLYFGMEIECPDVAQLFVHWDQLKSHESFKVSPDYEPMLKSLEAILAGPPQLLHFDFNTTGDLKGSMTAPVTQLATFFLPDKSSAFDSNLHSFAQVLEENAEGFLGVVHGWSIEPVEHQGLGAGIKGRSCLLSIGWRSTGAHMAFKDTEAFQRCSRYWEEAKGVELHHTKCNKM